MASSDSPNGVPTFLTKLLSMVADEHNCDLIHWSTNGETIIVTDADKLAERELRKYFKHGNFTSLVRQLNMYGFHKVTAAGGVKVSSDDQPEVWEFIHPCVQRDHPDLLKHVKRKVNSQSAKRHATGKDRKSTNEILEEMKILRTANKKLQDSFKTVKRQNEELWNEVAHHRKRHAEQQWKIERIMKYLAALYKNGEITLPNTDVSGNIPASKRPRIEKAAETSSLRASSASAIKTSFAEPPDLLNSTSNSSLEQHLSLFDEHLDQKKSELNCHMDQAFIDSIFNPPTSHTDVTMKGLVQQNDPDLGIQKGNATTNDFWRGVGVFTPLDDILQTEMQSLATGNDAVVPGDLSIG